MANDNNVVNVQPSRGYAYMGDGPMGLGEFLRGLAATHLHQSDVRTDNLQRDVNRDFAEDFVRTFTHLTGAERACLVNFIAEACDDYTNHVYEKENAKEDVREAIDTIFDRYVDNDLPRILSRECKMGIYNDTATQLLLNDAYSSTVIKAGELQLGTIHKYVGHITQLGSLLANGLQVAINDTSREVLDRDINEDTVTKDTGTQSNDMNRDINMTKFVQDFIVLIAAQAVMTMLESWLLRSYRNEQPNT
jgi:hypothetical protein